MKKEFITNIYNPNLPNAIEYLVKNEDETKRKIIFEYLMDKIKELEIGDPIPTETKSIEELKATNIVGLYSGKHTSKYVLNFFIGNDNTKKNLYEPENTINDINVKKKITKVEVDIDY